MTPQGWDDGPSSDLVAEVLSRPDLKDLCLPAACPVCGNKGLHVFFRRHGPAGMGGAWIWCSHCRRFFHGRSAVPRWWQDAEFVADGDLVAVPGELDLLSVEVDQHWNSLEEVDSPGGAE